MRGRFVGVIEGATGRRFMSGNQQDPDMICEVFVLAPTSSSAALVRRAVNASG